MREPESVETRIELVGYIEALRHDLAANPNGWENATLDDFLEALEAYTRDIDGWFANRGELMPEQPTWKLVAQLLTGARIYE